MGKMADRKPKLSFGAATQKALRDNTIGGPEKKVIATPKAEAPPEKKTVPPQAKTATRQNPKEDPKLAETRARVAANPSLNVTLRLQIADEAVIDEASSIASAAGVDLNVSMSGFVKAAIEELQTLLKSKTLDLKPVTESGKSLMVYERSLRIKQADLERIIEAVDPYHVFSRTRSISHAVAQLMDPKKRA